MKIHLFNPENDIALSRDCGLFTPPAAAVSLQKAGCMLPLLWADDGDALIVRGWEKFSKESIQNLVPEPLKYLAANKLIINTIHKHLDLKNAFAAPWGWSKAAKDIFIQYGIQAFNLPDARQLAQIRSLSHRRISIRILEAIAKDKSLATNILLAKDFPVECKDVDSAMTSIEKFRVAMIKTPWSCSGRGVFSSESMASGAMRNIVASAISSQDSVIVEKKYAKVLDFAMLFKITDGDVGFLGYSLFSTAGGSHYSGNLVASQQAIYERIAAKAGDDSLLTLQIALPQILADIIGKDYSGIFGVDMLIDQNGKIYPCVELNLRNTMGYVAIKLFERRKELYGLPKAGSYIFRLASKKELSGSNTLTGNAISLSPQDSDMRFIIFPEPIKD